MLKSKNVFSLLNAIFVGMFCNYCIDRYAYHWHSGPIVYCQDYTNNGNITLLIIDQNIHVVLKIACCKNIDQPFTKCFLRYISLYGYF